MDDDGDMINDALDAFPYDPTEWSDNDGDNIGDNADTDDDDDGVNDEEDAFPLDGSEEVDTDGDGRGDNADKDDDDDGWTDTYEAQQGTDPLLADTDGDGYSDPEDSYPLDSSKHEESSAVSGFGGLLALGAVMAAMFVVRGRLVVDAFFRSGPHASLLRRRIAWYCAGFEIRVLVTREFKSLRLRQLKGRSCRVCTSQEAGCCVGVSKAYEQHHDENEECREKGRQGRIMESSSP